jgi:hypothetical protein
MTLTTRRVAACLLIVFCVSAAVGAVGGDKAMYVGGTIPGLAEKMEGKLATVSETELTFQAKGAGVAIPYAAISSLEYGQKAGRRVGVAIMISPLALFSKKRKHFLTIGYTDKNGKEQAGVFDLGKDIVRTTLTVLQVRTGKQIEYQDNEACKQFKTPKECEGGK